MKAIRVFISYSHDSTEHSERVLALAWALRNNGIDVELDQFHNEEIVDWPRWCRQRIKPEQSDFVLCICTAEYQRRIEGGVPPEKGKGVHWEGSLLDDEIYNDKGNRRIIPVLFDGEPESSILDFLRGWTFCRLNEFTLGDESYEQLLRILTGQVKVEKNVLGTLPILPTRRTPGGLSSAAVTSFRADISRIDKYAPAELIGRDEELKLLNDAWDKAVRGEAKRPHVLTFVALGGEGKTSLVAKWAADLAFQNWPGCDAAFAWSFYSQGTRDQVAASSDLFLKEALTFFGDDADKEFAASSAGAFEKGQRLARIVGRQRSLLILDGLEPLQYAPTSPTAGELKDQGIAALLKGSAAVSHGVCIVTTRYSLPDLKAFWQTTAPERPLVRLSKEAGVHLLQQLGVRKESGSKAEFERLVEDVKGHALTLTLFGGFLKRAFHGDIRQRDRVKFEKADEKIDGGHAFRTMAAYEQWLLRDGGDEGRREVAVMRLMGLFDRPADAGCLAALRGINQQENASSGFLKKLRAKLSGTMSETIPGLTEALEGLADDDWEYCLSGLEAAKLLTVNRDAAGALVSLDAHPHLREYFARQIREQQPDAWRAAHRRLYEHLCATTTEGDQPTLEDLQPLYQAVAHGCQAGLQEEAYESVFFSRIQKGNDAYAVKQLGVFGSDLAAVACFFDDPWKRPASVLSEESQAFLLNRAFFRLRALGRLTEAAEPLRTALEWAVKQEQWRSAAARAVNLCELDLTLGAVAGAVGNAEQSVTYADRSGDAFMRETNRPRVADALHQAGRRAEAETRFREAEQLQSERTYPLLYSLSGFQYCGLLLAAPERSTWQMMLELNTQNLTPETSIESCRAVSQRATQTLEWAELNRVDILSAALDHLTLGRAALYKVVLAVGGLPFKTENPELKTSIDATVDRLRRAAYNEFIVGGLLTRAWLRALTRARTGPESAQEDLDEAWEIAERGPMRLFMADIHLYRARLFGGTKDEGGGMKYPWATDADGNARGPKDDLAAARKLIEQCGYWRRKEELEDAEEASKNW